MQKVIIIGASSGVGLQLAKFMAKDDFCIGLTGRRTELLVKLQSELHCKTYSRYMDIANTPEAMKTLNELIDEMGGVDLIFVSSGIGHINYELNGELEQETINVNVSGVTAVINTAMQYFLDKKSGHLAVMSSVASLRGNSEGPAYSASKAYISNYAEGLRCKVKKQNLEITITDIKAGFIDTAMAKGEGLFWVMPLEKATQQIYKALLKKKDEVYITKRWRLIGFMLKVLPKFLYYKI
ncbi:MAG: SDR family NAD(P)-dependent oxidoreductase [Syntrophobacterales bacterium]|jgi:short-subunit dehydrogenase|nr:SDR family NAD(P)-dependent oxidoreductase [Syntrophobacterales bacterium]